MKPIQKWLNEYAESHQHPINITIHWFCVPLIMLSIIGLLANIKLNIHLLPDNPNYNHAGLILIFCSSIYYYFLSKPLLFGMLPISILMLLIINWLSTLTFPLWKTCLLIFIFSWISQFYGHKIEGKKPSFFQDIQFLLIGPAWILGFIYKKLKIKF